MHASSVPHLPVPTPTAPAGHRTTPSLTGAQRAAAHASVSHGAQHHATHLVVDAVSHSYPDRRVLNSISFTAAPGDRLGLVGENGTGKSTLLRIIAGELVPRSGSVSVPGSVGLLAQELPYPADTPIARVLDDAQAEALAILDRLERLGTALAETPTDPDVSHAYANALESAEQSGAWAAEARRGDVISGLGLSGIAEHRAIGTLSGGQRLRLALAATLLAAPQTLLLDEPSNHLDDASASYLERVLREWPGIVIVASHDRTLLDAVTTRILDLDPLPLPARELADTSQDAASDASHTDDPGSGYGARVWGVGYSEARAARRAELRRWRARYEAEAVEIAALEHEIAVGSREVNRKHESKSESRITKKFYADKDARVTARRARNARVRLDTLEQDRVRRPPRPLHFAGFTAVTPDAFQEPSQDRPRAVLVVDSVAVAGRLAEVSFSLPEQGRLLLTGPNGSGKSTLLSVIAGTVTRDSGSIERSATLGYLPQEVVFDRPDRTAHEHYRDVLGDRLAEAYPLAQSGLLALRDLDRPVGTLSVGQRRRLALATLVVAPPQLLLLDEPTNHLSLTLVEELEEALAGYPGALVIATHDRWLRSRWTGDELSLDSPDHSLSTE